MQSNLSWADTRSDTDDWIVTDKQSYNIRGRGYEKKEREERKVYEGKENRTGYFDRIYSCLLYTSKVTMETLDFSGLSEMAAAEMAVMAEEKGIRLETNISPGVMLYGDETLLIRLWLNLLQNAVTYGKEGGCIYMSLQEMCIRDRDTAGLICTSCFSCIFLHSDHSNSMVCGIQLFFMEWDQGYGVCWVGQLYKNVYR